MSMTEPHWTRMTTCPQGMVLPGQRHLMSVEGNCLRVESHWPWNQGCERGNCRSSTEVDTIGWFGQNYGLSLGHEWWQPVEGLDTHSPGRQQWVGFAEFLNEGTSIAYITFNCTQRHFMKNKTWFPSLRSLFNKQECNNMRDDQKVFYISHSPTYAWWSTGFPNTAS